MSEQNPGYEELNPQPTPEESRAFMEISTELMKVALKGKWLLKPEEKLERGIFPIGTWYAIGGEDHHPEGRQCMTYFTDIDGSRKQATFAVYSEEGLRKTGVIGQVTTLDDEFVAPLDTYILYPNKTVQHYRATEPGNVTHYDDLGLLGMEQMRSLAQAITTAEEEHSI